MIVAGVLGGMAWAAIPAFLKTQLNVNEILSSLMLTYVAIQLLYWLMNGPWKDPAGFNFPQTPAVQPEPDPARGRRAPSSTSACRSRSSSRSRVWFLMAKTTFGFQVRVVGAAPQAARYGGFSRDRTIWLDAARRRRARRARRHLRGRRPLRPDGAAVPDRLRLHRDHRRLPRPAAPGRHRARRHRARRHLRRRRGGAGRARAARARPPASSRRCCCSSCSPPTSWSRYRLRLRRPRAEGAA